MASVLCDASATVKRFVIETGMPIKLPVPLTVADSIMA